MITPKVEHVGSGVDSPKRKTISEKLYATAGKIIAPMRNSTGNEVGQPVQPQMPGTTPEDMTS